MQTKADLEKFYENPDPWGYIIKPDDEVRRTFLYFIPTLLNDASFKRILDIGAGEGLLLQQFVYTEERHAIELSDNAAARFPHGVTRVKRPQGKYDLVFATGVLYEQYDYKQMREWIEEAAQGIVLTCHYDKAGVAHDIFDKPQIFYAEFPYRDGKQILRVYKW